jgi:restriction system protein
MLEKTVSNRFLNESKTIKAKTEYELNEKIKKQKKQWKEKEQLERMKIEAQTKTKHAQKAIEDYDSLLIKSLNTSHIIDWDNFYDNTNFDVPEPTLNQFIIQVGVPKEDKFIEFLFSSFRKKREEKQKEAERLFHNAYTEYHYEKNRFLNDQKLKNNEVKVFKDSFESGNKDSIENILIRYWITPLTQMVLKKLLNLNMMRRQKI